MKVCLIDDDPEDAELFQDAIKRIDNSIEFVWFDDGMTGLNSFLKEGNLPDILFLDVNLPQVSGKELLKLFRENQITRSLQIVIYSTSISKRDIEETSVYDVKHYLQKPESFEALYSELKEIIT